MAVIDLPCEIMRPRDASFFLRWTTRSAGRRLSDGQEQITSPGYAVWEVEYSLGLEFNQTRIKQFEAAISSLRGRSNIARVCVCDPFRYGAKVSPTQQPWSDGTWFSDGTGWVDAGTVQAMTTTQPAVAGDTAIWLALTNPVRPALRVGDMFSVNDFLYRVTAVGSNGFHRIEPPIRTPFPVGTTIQTDPPMVRVRLATDDQGRRGREFLRWGQPVTVSFVEAFER